MFSGEQLDVCKAGAAQGVSDAEKLETSLKSKSWEELDLYTGALEKVAWEPERIPWWRNSNLVDPSEDGTPENVGRSSRNFEPTQCLITCYLLFRDFSGRTGVGF